MGVAERELARLEAALHEPQTPERYCQLYAAQQALAWVTEPAGFASPYETVMRERVQAPKDTPANLEDCLAQRRLPLS
jgi:hypothetical protein